METYSFTLPDTEAALRLDQAVSLHVPGLSREQARKFIEIGAVWINNQRVQILSKKVFAGDTVTLYSGREGWKKYYGIDPVNILYEDEWLLAYRKEPGVPTQGLVCDNYNNLFSALRRYLKKKNALPYIGMHQRLDLDTSGVVLFTLSQKINRSIHYQFKDHRVKKIYCALVQGTPDFQQKTLSTFISRRDGAYRCSAEGPGKIATTTFTSIAGFPGYSLIRAEPKTGRTHQLRLQLAFLGLPILGDRLYGTGADERYPRTMLHAQSLTVFHPLRKEDITITADLFEDMKQLIL